jgi:phosphoribosylformylglycinamidine synthase II
MSAREKLVSSRYHSHSVRIPPNPLECRYPVSTPPQSPIHRFEVRSAPGREDPRGHAAARAFAAVDDAQAPEAVNHASVYLVQGELDTEQCARVAEELLADPVSQSVHVGASPAPKGSALIEVHPLPGVTDPAADSVELAVKAMTGVDTRVQTGNRFELLGTDQATARSLVERSLANPVIHAIHETPFKPEAFATGTIGSFEVREVPVRELLDDELDRLSRDAHLFLDLHEMIGIRDYYRELGRDPREIELETLAQTWSEHCVHKTLKSTIRYRELGAPTGVSVIKTAGDRPHHDLVSGDTVQINNLLKATVAAATFELMDDGIDWCLSVFVDNAGVIVFDDDHAVCFKAETHNHPSAIEPYGGAATGIGGCIRDIMGTGLAAKPIAATDVFCVAYPTIEEVPAGCLHPQRILTQVVGGVRDYGNRMGIPTVNGTVYYDNDYVGNPLVYCGCIGVMPRDCVKGAARPGDRIISIGGRTGRDGIHGATFSSAELTDTHADEFSHAVQIGNAITEKKALDAILAMRDEPGGCLFSGITDCGAGGYSSAVGEMGEALGAEVDLERVPLKYAGLTPTETWISEAQERMVLAVPADRIERLAEICAEYEAEYCDLGHFGTENRELILRHDGVEFGRMSMAFLHDGIPTPVREACWDPQWASEAAESARPEATLHNPQTGLDSIPATTCALLAHPNICSKEWIIRQYDHEVQGGSVIKPLVGVGSGGPSDGAVIRPVPESTRALAIANGLATGLRSDPYVMTLAAIDECVRNLVCVGADPERIAILDNYCWPSCSDERNLGSLVRASEGCYDGAKAYRTPFISGKDSLNNQFTREDGETIQIPPTLLISGMGLVEDCERAVSSDLKRAGNLLVLVGDTGPELGGSHFALISGLFDTRLPMTDLEVGPQTARSVAKLIQDGLVRSAHDCSEGGLMVAASEMAFAGGLGLDLDLGAVPTTNEADLVARAFAEHPSRYLLEIAPGDLDAVREILGELPHDVIATVQEHPTVTLHSGTEKISIELERLREAWSGDASPGSEPA